MYSEISTIEKIINNFEGEEKKEMINYYIKLAKEKLEDSSVFDNRKISLLKSIIDFLPSSEQERIKIEAMKLKVVQIRAVILDLISCDYSSEQNYFFSPEKWIKEVIKDFLLTFDLENKEDRKLLEIYNEQLCSEFILIFCSCEKFNTAGNLLILNFLMYIDFLTKHINFDFDEFFNQIYSYFNEGKAASIEDLQKVYDAYKASNNTVL